MTCNFNDHFGIMAKWDNIKSDGNEATYKCPKCGEEDVIKITKGLKIDGDKVAAIWTDDKGSIIKTNSKGNIINSSAYDNDPKGWKTAGKKISKYTQDGKIQKQ